MAKYVDGFVLNVPTKNLAAYRKMAKMASKIWLEHGALEYYEAAGEDMKVKMGIPFPKLANTKKNETVIFAWIVYKSRKHRDKVNAAVMKDPRLASMGKEMPFDMKRMCVGGFETLVQA